MDGNLRRLRESKALSRKDLAELSGVDATTIYRLERGRVHRPIPRTIRNLAGALGVDVEVLTSRQGSLGLC
jgi:transcriptional regulator with XRE-family HTH domain